jgi:hypothetical protein
MRTTGVIENARGFGLHDPPLVELLDLQEVRVEPPE